MELPMRLRFCVLALLVGLFAPRDAMAAKFVAGLTSLKVAANPGEVSTHAYQLTLDKGERPTRFRFKIEDWWRSPDGSQSYYAEPGTLNRSCGTWVSLNPVEAVVEPGETLVTRITLSVPSDVAAGGYWCVLTVDEVADPLSAPTGVGATFVASVSTGIFVYIEPVKRALEFVDVAVGGERTVLTLRNDGNAPLGVEGRFEFLAPGALSVAAVVPIPRTTLLTEPFQVSTVTLPLPPLSALPPGRYLVRAIVDIGLDHYLGVEREVDVPRDTAVLNTP
jgi:hypothetical protein